MINKQKMGLTGNKASGSNSQQKGSGGGQEGGGPQNYDGRANTNAGTPPYIPGATAFDGPGQIVTSEE